MNEREKIIDKIKKCLALSSSSNEHEAAAALRQAEKLMEQHGVSDLDMQAAEANEKRARSGAMKRPANWETVLAAKIADAFGCQMIFAYDWKGYGEWVFIGTGAAPEVAEYAFRVLFRQGKNARAEHIKYRLRRCKQGTKTRRADLFSEGWVRAVTSLIKTFSGGESKPEAIDAYMASHYPALGELKTHDRNGDRKLRPHEETDYWHGRDSGRDAQLNRGMGGASPTLALE